MANQPTNTDPTGADAPRDDAAEKSEVSRRDFILRAGRYGLAASLAGPFVGRALWPRAAAGAPAVAPASPEALSHGILSTALRAPVDARLFSGLQWRMLGPFRGGRTDAVTGVPGRPNEFYFGSVNGGLWKSIDAGRVWEPVFDSQPVASIGAVAVAPSAPDTVYVGTGECTLRDSTGFGNGVYKSTDGGRSWTHLGLEQTQHIGKIAVHPHNPDVAYVAAIGHFYSGNPDRGVFRTRDGGKTWKKVLFKNNDVGAIEVQIDPSNPNVVYAGLWNTRRPPWFVYAPSNGPGGGIYKSTDGGDSWKELTNGLPTQGMGKSGIAISASHPNRVYAVIDNLELAAGIQAARTGGRLRRRRHGAGRVLPLRRRRRALDQDVGRRRALGPRLVLRARRVRSEEPRHRLRVQRRRVAHRGRGQDVGGAPRVARRGRLPSGVGLAPTTPTR